MKQFAVVMAGGIGKRLWPISTPQRPKQLIEIENVNFLQRRIDMLGGIADDVFISVSPIIAPQLQGKFSNLIIEPEKRGTLGAVMWSLRHLSWLCQNEDFVVGFFPADHYVKDVQALSRDIQKAYEFAWNEGRIVLIGTTPTEASTSYGYINVFSDSSISYVNAFYEKPSEGKALFMKNRGWLWNSGIFVFRYSSLIMNLPKNLKLHANMFANDGKHNVNKLFSQLPDTSFDKGFLEPVVQESCTNCACVVSNVEWTDIGNIQNMLSLKESDERYNKIYGQVNLLNSHHICAWNETNIPVTIKNILHIIVVCTNDGILIEGIN